MKPAILHLNSSLDPLRSKNRDLRTTHNTFRGCCGHLTLFFFSDYLSQNSCMQPKGLILCGAQHLIEIKKSGMCGRNMPKFDPIQLRLIAP